MSWLLGYKDTSASDPEDSLDTRLQEQQQAPTAAIPNTLTTTMMMKSTRRTTALDLNTTLDVSAITPRIVAMGLPWRRRTEKV